jgi:hypothetical protein
MCLERTDGLVRWAYGVEKEPALTSRLWNQIVWVHLIHFLAIRL